MPRKTPEGAAWFSPKRYGYGASLPTRWQGWAVLGGYGAVVALVVWLAQKPDPLAQIGAGVLMFAATLALVAITRRHTRGGWRWRWGEKD